MSVKLNRDSRWDKDSDDADPNVYTVNEDTMLSWDKVTYERNLAHPRTYNLNPDTGNWEYKKWPIIESETGCLSCKSETHKSDFVQYGTGVVLFFQFTKFMTFIFFFLVLMSIP